MTRTYSSRYRSKSWLSFSKQLKLLKDLLRLPIILVELLEIFLELTFIFLLLAFAGEVLTRDEILVTFEIASSSQDFRSLSGSLLVSSLKIVFLLILFNCLTFQGALLPLMLISLNSLLLSSASLTRLFVILKSAKIY